MARSPLVGRAGGGYVATCVMIIGSSHEMVKGLLLYAAESRRLSSVGQYPVDVTMSYPASKAKEVCPRSAT